MTAEIVIALVVTFQTASGQVSGATIIGRASCGSTTWLLTEKPELIEIRHTDKRVTAHAIQGLVSGDKLWGLGCLGDGTLRTLAAPRVIARIDALGRLLDRTPVRLPRVGLYASDDRLLQQTLPITAGASALAVAPAARPEQSAQWAGLTTRTAASREREIARNLVVCGLAFQRTMPCWFADGREVIASNGTTFWPIPMSRLLSVAADREAPIRDVALVGQKRYWLLESGMAERGVTGTRISLIDEASSIVAVRVLRPGARLILTAASNACLLLTVDGTIVEMTATP